MQNATTVIVVEGALNIHETKIISAAIAALSAQDQVNIVIDWTKAEAINPLAIGLLLGQRHALLQKSGELKFCRMRREIRQVFFKFGVDELFESYATLEDAIESFDEEWAADNSRSTVQ